MNQQSQDGPVARAVEITVSLFLIFLIVAWCLKIMLPFVMFISWGAVIAVSTYRPFLKMRDKLGGKLAVTLFTIIGLGLVIVPAWMFAGSMLESAQSFSQSVEQGSFEVSPPNDSVQSWPLVGEKIHAAWSNAAGNFEQFLVDYRSQLTTAASFAMNKVAGIGSAVLLFVFAILLAAAMLANDEAVIAEIRRFFRRVAGDRGEEMLQLSSATIRSVTVGVMGIAFIQAVAAGAGMVLVDVPGAGVWALLILILVIAQLPALIVLAPVILWVFSVESTTVAVVFMIWSVLVSLSDIFLKPLLLGRGVEAPMLVILLGAIGGMIMSGILGLFLGAVVLALGYKLYVAWLNMGEASAGESVAPDPLAGQVDS